MTSPSQPQTPPPATKPVAAPPPAGAALLAGQAALIASITALLASGYGAAMIPTLIISRLVKWGILLAVAQQVVAMSGRRPGGMPATVGVASKAVRTAEFGYRASYIVHACLRLMDALAKGDDFDQALAAERRYHQDHMDAIQHRAMAARGVDRAAAANGPLLGWYLGLEARDHTPFCLAASGHNFAVDKPPRGFYPGTPHRHCACWAGPPFPGAISVAQATSSIKGI